MSKPSTGFPHRVLIHGLPYFGKMLAALMNGNGWDFRYHRDKGVGNLIALARDLRACDLVYQLGGRISPGKFLHAAKFLRKGRIVVHWVGSDVLHAQADFSEGKFDPWVARNLRHWAEVPWMVEEVRRMGLECDCVPLSSALIPAQPSFLPKQFTVLVYMPDIQKAELYGLNTILKVARELPSISFQLVGLYKGRISEAPSNLTIRGWIHLSSVYEHVTVLWRPVRHDGLSFMVLEALGHGRHVLWSYEFPGCIRVSDAAEARRELERLYELHQKKSLRINEAGLKVIAENYHPRRVKEEILRRFREIIATS